MEIYLSPWILLLLPSWIIIYKHCLRDYQKLQLKAKCWSTCVEWKKQTPLHWWDCWHCIVCNIDSPIHIHKFIPPEVWKAFNVGINAWNITAIVFSNEDRTTCFLLFPGDSSLYTLRCIRCVQLVTLAGSIGETLLHAPTAMLYHWNMIQYHDEQNHRELMLMPLLFTSYDNYLRS